MLSMSVTYAIPPDHCKFPLRTHAERQPPQRSDRTLIFILSAIPSTVAAARGAVYSLASRPPATRGERWSRELGPTKGQASAVSVYNVPRVTEQ